MRVKGAEIAGRIRGLIAGQAESLTAMAELLGVHETALRISLDDVAPYPTLEVIAAVIAKYGVDPSWLLTGEYDPEIHRRMLESRTDELPNTLSALIQPMSQDPGILPFRLPLRRFKS